VLKVLVIDDSRVVRKMMVESLRAEFAGAAVDEYDPCIQGFPGSEFGWSYYDIVFLDYNLGLAGEDGITWLRKFQNFADMPPVIMLTDEERVSVIVKAIKVGAKDYVLKRDLKNADLANIIYRALGIEGDDAEANTLNEIPALETPTAATERTHSHDESVHTTQRSESIATRRNGVPQDAIRVNIPGYRIIAPIAQGGMTTIFLAQRVEDDLEIVLKLMFTRDQPDTPLLRYFMQEYALISKLNHPYIIKIFERAFAKDFAYIAMEYLPAGNLVARIRKGLMPDKALHYIRQIAEALGAVHNLSIVHRDLKPSNILFRQNDTVAISDFGVAHFAAGMSGIDETQVLIGSPSYMSPEQCKRRPVDPRSDLYSLGVLMFEMLTGAKPYTGRSIPEIIDAHIRAPVPRLPDELRQYQPLIDGLMAKDPAERFQSAGEFIAGLEWICQG
jgi:serine/threonine-protein kinase PpkA